MPCDCHARVPKLTGPGPATQGQPAVHTPNATTATARANRDAPHAVSPSVLDEFDPSFAILTP